MCEEDYCTSRPNDCLTNQGADRGLVLSYGMTIPVTPLLKEE